MRTEAQRHGFEFRLAPLQDTAAKVDGGTLIAIGKLFKDAQQAGQAMANRHKVKEFVKQRKVERLLHLLQTVRVGLRGGALILEIAHLIVHNDCLRRYRRGKHNAPERAATAQRHVSLAVRKGGGGVNHHAVERQALAFVNGNRPSEFQGILAERAIHHFLHHFRFLVQHKVRIVPSVGGYGNRFLAFGGAHLHLAVGKCRDRTDHAVVVTLLRVVFYKHHLCTLFQFEFVFRGIGEFGECARHGGRELMARRFQVGEFLIVNVVSLLVVRSEAHVMLLSVRLKPGHVSLIQFIERGGIGLALADTVEQGNKRLVALAINVFQFYCHERGLL